MINSTPPSPELSQASRLQGQAPVQEQGAPAQIEQKDRNVSDLKVRMATPKLDTADPAKAAKLRESMALTGGSMPVRAGHVEKSVNSEGKKLVAGKLDKKEVAPNKNEVAPNKNAHMKKLEEGGVQKFQANFSGIIIKMKALEETGRAIGEKLDNAKDFKEIEILNRDLQTVRGDLQKLQTELKSQLQAVASTPALREGVSAEDLKNPQVLRTLIQTDHKTAIALMNKHEVDVKEFVNDLCKTPAGKKLASEFGQSIVRNDVENARTHQDVFRQTQSSSQMFIGALQTNLMSKPLEGAMSEISQRAKAPTNRETPEGLEKMKGNVSLGLRDLAASISKNTPPEMRAVYQAFAKAYVEKFPAEAGDVKNHLTSFLVLKMVNPKLTTSPELSPDERKNAVAFSKVLQLAVNNNTEIKGEDWQKPLKGWAPDVKANDKNEGVNKEGQVVTNDPNNFIAASQPQIDELYKAMIG